MTEQTAPTRRLLKEDFTTVAARFPAIGKLMVIGKTDAVTHERIGPVESVGREGGFFLCGGENHDSRIEGGAVVEMVVDTSSIMRDQVYPRIDFNGADNRPVFSIVGFGGLEPFEAALEGLRLQDLPVDEDKPERKQRPDVADADPGRLPIEAAQASGEPITIAFEGKGFSQRWTGKVEKISLGMGFINVMTGDFHLHLPGGSVARWEQSEGEGGVRLDAYDAEGRAIGLSLSAKTAEAFAAQPQAAE